MTPHEFNLAVEAFAERERLDMRKRAIVARWLLAAWVKRVPSVRQLVGGRGRSLLGAPNAVVKAHCAQAARESLKKKAQ